MAFAPDAADHLFLTGPISSIAAGLLLIAPARSQDMAGCTGSITRWSNARRHHRVDRSYSEQQGDFHCRCCARPMGRCCDGIERPSVLSQLVSVIALRILGSWLLAIGLLYGRRLPRQASRPSVTARRELAGPTSGKLASVVRSAAAAWACSRRSSGRPMNG